MLFQILLFRPYLFIFIFTEIQTDWEDLRTEYTSLSNEKTDIQIELHREFLSPYLLASTHQRQTFLLLLPFDNDLSLFWPNCSRIGSSQTWVLPPLF